jgi:hypothetical protein
MLTKILLGFTIMCNFATLLGLWIAYEAAPSTLQSRVGHVLTWSGATASAILYLFAAWFVLRTRVGASEAHDSDASDGDGATDFRQLFLDEQISREKYQDQFVTVREERDQLKKELEQLRAQKPDLSVKDEDPKLEIKIADLRGITMSDKPSEQACFDLINRGKRSEAKFVCIEDFYIGSYFVAFRDFPRPIKPFGEHQSISPFYINKPDGKLSNDTIFSVFLYAWSDLHNPQLYEFSVPIKVTYQDDARNLFEVRCDLVWYPSEHANVSLGKRTGAVIEIKNHKVRKVAAAHPVNWSD